MKGLKIIWGILLLCALLLVLRAVRVFDGLTAGIGALLVTGAAESLNNVAAYAKEAQSGETGASIPEQVMREFSVNHYASESKHDSESKYALGSKYASEEEAQAGEQPAEDADGSGAEDGADAETESGDGDLDGAGIEDETSDPFFLLGESGLIPELPLSGADGGDGESLPVEYAQGEVEPVVSQTIYPDWSARLEELFPLAQMRDLTYLLNHFYIVDSSTSASAEEFDLDTLLSMDLTIEKQSGSPQILIYHTHGSEGYIDSREGNYEDTVMGVGDYLTEILTEQYGYEVYHDQNVYDRRNGRDNRNYAYTTALPYITEILEENPSIEVVIDLHRDGGAKRVTEIDGEEVAQIMLFNGLCRNANGPLADLENPYLQENLAFSLRLNLIGQSMYPGLMFKIYLKNYRYNMHVSPKALLVELGTNENTLEEAMNAMPYFAQILDQVLNSR